jgi:hypothetical protein
MPKKKGRTSAKRSVDAFGGSGERVGWTGFEVRVEPFKVIGGEDGPEGRLIRMGGIETWPTGSDAEAAWSNAGVPSPHQTTVIVRRSWRPRVAGATPQPIGSAQRISGGEAV